MLIEVNGDELRAAMLDIVEKKIEYIFMLEECRCWLKVDGEVIPIEDASFVVQVSQ